MVNADIGREQAGLESFPGGRAAGGCVLPRCGLQHEPDEVDLSSGAGLLEKRAELGLDCVDADAAPQCVTGEAFAGNQGMREALLGRGKAGCSSSV